MGEYKQKIYFDIKKREFDGKFVVWGLLYDPYYAHLTSHKPRTWIAMNVCSSWSEAMKFKNSHDSFIK